MIRKRLDKFLQFFIIYSFWGLLFLLPLVMNVNNSEVFELPKMLFVYASTILIAGAWIARMIVGRRIIIRSTPLDIPILLFLLSQVVSTAFSIEPRTSLLGYYSRFHGGLLSTICYSLLYFALVNNWQPLKKLWRATPEIIILLASSFIVSVYAILQHFGIDKDYWVQDVVNRVFSTQGQPNWLAAQLVMTLPLGWALVCQAKSTNRTKKNKDRLIIWRFGYLIIATLALLWTKSRSGLLGLFVAGTTFYTTIYYVYRSVRKKTGVKSQFNRISIIIGALTLGLMLLTQNPAGDRLTGLFQNNSIVTPETAISGPVLESDFGLRKSEHGGTESGDIRRIVWKGAIDLVRMNPLVGTGPDTFAYTYWRVRPPEHNLTSEWNFLYNRAHNEWLNLAANTGLFGLGTYLLLLFWFTVWIIKSIKFGTLRILRVEAAYIASGILAGFWGVEAVDFFGFSTVTVGVYRYLFMAMAILLITPAVQLKSKKKNNPNKLFGFKKDYLMLGGLVLTAGYLLTIIGMFLAADLNYNRGRRLLEAAYVTDSLEPLENATELIPAEPLFRVKLAEAQALTALLLETQDEASMAAEFVGAALDNFSLSYAQNPRHLTLLRSRARMTFNLGSLNGELYRQGIKLMELAVSLSPTDPRGPEALGMMYKNLGDQEQAQQYYREAVRLKPDYNEAAGKIIKD